MLTPRSFLIALTFCPFPVAAQTVRAPVPNANIEARTARELNALTPTILNRHSGKNSDGDKIRLALAFARLGRIDAALRAANAMDVQDAQAANSGGLARDEVSYLGARRRAILGNIGGARTLAGEIKSARLRADALLSVERAQMRAGDRASAQKTLFEALALVGQNRRAQIYIAVLFYRAGNSVASKRLLGQVERVLPALKPATTTAPQPLNVVTGNDDWRYLAWALLQTKQAEKGAQLLNDIEGSNTAPTLHSLVRVGALDTALRLARANLDAQSQLSALLATAWAIARISPERAAPILEDIGQRLQNLPPDTERPDGDFLSRPQQDALLLGALRRRVGDTNGAKELLNTLVAQVGPAGAAYARLSFALAPFSFEVGGVGDPPRPLRLTRPQIEQISAEVNAALALPASNVFNFIGVLPEFVDAQIKLGAQESARRTLALLETKVLSDHDARQKRNGQAPDGLYAPLSIAQRWQKLGDSKRTSEWLNRVWNSSLARGMEPRQRAWQFIFFGFVHEGKRRLAMVGPLSQEAFYLSPSLPYFEAKSQPSIFPSWIQNLRDPQMKLTALADFSLGLTQPLFESLQERESMPLSGGLGYAGYSISY